MAATTERSADTDAGRALGHHGSDRRLHHNRRDRNGDKRWRSTSRRRTPARLLPRRGAARPCHGMAMSFARMPRVRAKCCSYCPRAAVRDGRSSSSIAERFQRFLVHLGDYGAVILDHREGTQDDRLRRFFRRLADNGTPYTRLERIVDPILLSPSHHTLGIQAADLVVGSSLSISRADTPRISSRRAAIAREVHQRLLPCSARHPHTGAIDGVGIKRFPDPSLAAADKLRFRERCRTVRRSNVPVQDPEEA
jgi:Protein of unknown function (DUF3800)